MSRKFSIFTVQKLLNNWNNWKIFNIGFLSQFSQLRDGRNLRILKSKTTEAKVFYLTWAIRFSVRFACSYNETCVCTQAFWLHTRYVQLSLHSKSKSQMQGYKINIRSFPPYYKFSNMRFPNRLCASFPLGRLFASAFKWSFSTKPFW